MGLIHVRKGGDAGGAKPASSIRLNHLTDHGGAALYRIGDGAQCELRTLRTEVS